MTAGWPVELADGAVGLRPLRLRDSKEWREVRARNAEWLRPWEATSPDPRTEPAPTYSAMVRRLHADARAGRSMPFVVTFADRLVGQLTVSSITWGSLRGCSVGYWVDQRVAGRGIMPTAVAMASDHCWSIGLHRVEINIRPENAASLRVAAKLGLAYEGERRAYLHIDGAWRDHVTFAVYAGDFPDGVLAAYLAGR